MINIVVSRYKKNTDWTQTIQKYNTNIMIYDKENPDNKYNIPKNVGNEASVYLKYIVDNYDDLTDYTFFIHDEEYSWHHTGSLEERFIEAVQSREKFYNVNHYYAEPYSTAIHQKAPFHEWYEKFIEPYIPFEKLPNKDFLSGFKMCAQFLVHKDLIRHLPHKFYCDIYNWILDPPDAYACGYYLEWTWHVFWVISPHYKIYKG